MYPLVYWLESSATPRQSVVSAVRHSGPRSIPARSWLHEWYHTEALLTAHGFQEYWGYPYQLDAMQGVSFPDIKSSPNAQKITPPCMNTPIPGVPEVPGARRSEDDDLLDPSATDALVPL